MIWAIENDMAEILRADGDLEQAAILYADGLGDVPSFIPPHDRMIGLLNLAEIAIERGRLTDAREKILESLRVLADIPYDIRDLAGPWDVCAGYLAATGDFRHAAVLFGADRQQVDDTGLVKLETDQRFTEPLIQKTRAALGEKNFESAFSEGRQLRRETAYDEVKAWIQATEPDRTKST